MMQAITKALASQLSPAQKQRLKARVGLAQKVWISQFRSYDGGQLSNRLASMGIAAGDTVLLHSAYRSTNGFRGTPSDVIGVLRDLIGESGTLAMMSMPYTTSTKEYLASGPVFDVRRTPSHMGIITEIFRRSGAMRSLSPTHPILAAGAGAESYLAHHSECRYPCGPGSPFERMLHANAKVLFFDLPFVAFTFFHYIEHRLQDRLPFPLYEEAPMIARYLDYDGRAREAEVFVFTDEAIKRRRVAVIAGGTRRTGKSSWSRIGNTRLVLTTMADALDTTLRLADAGTLPYERSG